jgi:hypothetical protein
MWSGIVTDTPYNAAFTTFNNLNSLQQGQKISENLNFFGWGGKGKQEALQVKLSAMPKQTESARHEMTLCPLPRPPLPAAL